jgi:hypothetical protein
VSAIDFSKVVATTASSERNPWSVQVDLERESGLYIHPVTGEAISLGGMVIAARSSAGTTTMPDGRTYRESVKALLRSVGASLNRKPSLKEKVEQHAAIADLFGSAAAKKAAKAALKAL